MKKVKVFIELWKLARAVKGGTYVVMTDSGQELVTGKIQVFLWRIKCAEVTAHSNGIATKVNYISAAGEVVYVVKI